MWRAWNAGKKKHRANLEQKDDQVDTQQDCGFKEPA